VLLDELNHCVCAKLAYIDAGQDVVDFLQAARKTAHHASCVYPPAATRPERVDA